MADFANQKVVVTGATRGLGKAITLAFLEQGALVIGLYAGNKDAAESLRSECSSFAERLQLHQCDVSNYQAVEELFQKIEEEYDTIDILINNAGIRRDNVLAMIDEWKKLR